VTTSARLFVLAGLFLLAALVAGCWPMDRLGIACGSGWGGASEDQVSMQTGGGVDLECAGDRHDMRLVAVWLLTGAGISVAAGGVVVFSGRRRDALSMAGDSAGTDDRP
jgi:hypothetical protein